MLYDWGQVEWSALLGYVLPSIGLAFMCLLAGVHCGVNFVQLSWLRFGPLLAVGSFLVSPGLFIVLGCGIVLPWFLGYYIIRAVVHVWAWVLTRRWKRSPEYREPTWTYRAPRHFEINGVRYVGTLRL